MFLFIVLTVLNIFGTGCQSENVTISIDKSGVMFGNNVTLTCIYDGNRTESGIYWYNGSDTTGLFYLPSCTRISTPSLFYDTGRIFPTCNPSSNVYTLTITVQDYDFGREWCCSFSLTPNVRCSSNTIITGLTTTTTTTATTTVNETSVTSASESAPSTNNTLTAHTGENDSHERVIIISVSVSVGGIVIVTVIIIIIRKRKNYNNNRKTISLQEENSTNERNELQKVPETKSDKGDSNVHNQSSTRI